jgi:hypothetical protein
MGPSSGTLLFVDLVVSDAVAAAGREGMVAMHLDVVAGKAVLRMELPLTRNSWFEPGLHW